MKPKDIRQIRESMMLTQVEFAQTLGVSVDTARGWERGRRKPRPNHLRALTALQNGGKQSRSMEQRQKDDQARDDIRFIHHPKK